MGVVFPPKSESKTMRDFYYRIYDLPFDMRDNSLIELYELIDAEIREMELRLDETENDSVYEAEENTSSIVRDILRLKERVPKITKIKLQEELDSLVSYYS